MRVKIENLDQFVNCIHDYIVEEYEIYPRDFETRLLVGDKSLVWDKRTGEICEISCPKFNGPLHVHEQHQLDESKKNLVICCNEVDVIALRYLQGSIFGERKAEIITEMHDWLPAATMHWVRVTVPNRLVRVRSYFEPSYLFRFYDGIKQDNLSDLRQIDYTYIIGFNIVYPCVDYPDNDFYRDQTNQLYPHNRRINIMARRLNRARSSSPGTSSGTSSRRRRGRVGRRRRSRSRSPAMGGSSNAGGSSGMRRRRSRSRSRSSSRSRSTRRR